MTPNGLKYMLPEEFVPSEFDFVIGRGKQVKQHAGNKRLYDQIRSIADDYTSADKARKSFLLSHLVKQVYAKSPNAGFVKKDPSSGHWYAVEDALARTSAAQAVRDCLHNHYKSSRQFKQQRRRAVKEQTVPDMDLSMSVTSAMALPSFSRHVTPEESFYTLKQEAAVELGGAAPAGDLFSILASAFSTKSDPQEDPFMPIPLPFQMPTRPMAGIGPRNVSIDSILEEAGSILDDQDLDQVLLEPTPILMPSMQLEHQMPMPLLAALIPNDNLDDIFA